MVVLVHRAGLDLSQVASGQRSLHAVQVAVGEAQLDRPVLDAGHVLQQIATHALGEVRQRQALLGVGAFIHNEHRLHRIGRVINIAQRGRSSHHTDNSETVEIDTRPCALGHSPAEDRKLAGQADFGVGEARPSVDIGRTRFHIVAVNVI